MLFLPAPSGPPTNISTSDVKSFSITVQWGLVNCIQRNGIITDYNVRYKVEGSHHIQNMRVNNSSTEVTITGLHSATIYSMEVAAVNNAGTGVYSAAIIVTTKRTYCAYKILISFIPLLI